MSMTKFEAEYRKQLQIAVTDFPEDYPWTRPQVVHGNMQILGKPCQTVSEVAGKMINAIQTNTFSHGGRAMKATCKALGIKHTRKAIVEYVNS